MNKRVLMLNAGYCDEGTILALKRMGCYVITTGNRADLAGHKLADEYVYGDFSNKEQMLQIAKEKKVDAVCPCVSDLAVISAAYVAEQMGFSGHDSYEATLILHNKDMFKSFASKHEIINTPKAQQFCDEESALAWAEKNECFPMIVKPVDLDSGRGINRVENREDLLDAIKEAFSRSLAKRIVVEPFIVGTQHGFCAFLRDQKIVALSTENEYAFVDPYRVEVACYPASCLDQIRAEMTEQVEYMARVLNLSDGIFHAQFILHEGKAYIIECMRRVLGNLWAIPASKITGGFDWEYWNAVAKCGFPYENFPTVQNGGLWAFRALFASKPGVYQSVEIPAEYKKYIKQQIMLQESGFEITRPALEPVGYLFMNFESMQQMHKISVDEYERIRVITT